MSDNREGVEKDGEKTGTKQGKNEPMLCYFMDGTSRHLVHFDRLKEDAGYAGAIESAPERLVSSHAVKRFFYRLFRGAHLAISAAFAGIVSLASYGDQACGH